MVARGFDLVLSDTHRQLFRESDDIRLRVWGVSELGSVDYITFDGTLQSGGECVIAHGRHGVLDRRGSDEVGRLSLRGFPSSIIRKLTEAEKYFTLHVYVNMHSDKEEVLRVGEVNLTIVVWGEARITIGGLGEYRKAEVKLGVDDEWFIDPGGQMSYCGLHKDEEMARMPIWLKKAWWEWRLF
jgi:hypothetical protein